ncbi:dipeptide ABC transporter ATP-binding protein [Corynebacterium poyangense]|uniref:Dipeptide ABC transporter ATP-binding protein n=1 Tax=Corynebacterium poyangense TaxID=2684405 RepID=A0A7H0SQ40_9CORY|nr:ABC transporter ATP-binding protein [Corynebacterium poyangense]QNQ90665.1 dipeptide ABC transporter ATP-binding protein [Corynebacterium poyangense]
MSTTPPLLDVANLRLTGILDSISFSINPGDRVGLIGESGSGKSLSALSIVGLTPPPLQPDGDLFFQGKPLPRNERSLRKLRGKKIGMVFQEPMAALDPLMKAGKQVTEALHLHGVDAKTAQERTDALFVEVGLDPDKQNSYPHELSGGQRQRVLIAIALANDPDLLICDEPTTALDVTVQKQIVDLILKVVRERNTGLLFITHDLGLVQQVCERVVVLRQGKVVESGTTAEVFHHPREDYTKSLIASSLSRPRPHVPHHNAPVVLTARGITKIHPRPARKGGPVQALAGVDVCLKKGARLGIVGESGSGKSTLLRILAGLDAPTEGEVNQHGNSVQMVFQDPMSSLDPRWPVWKIVSEPLRAEKLSKAQRLDRVREVLSAVGLNDSALDRFPHEFSGGQRQRISLARALSIRPDILLADEPVSALDVSVRNQVLDLLEQLCTDYDVSLIFVSHDLPITRDLCEELIIMQRGNVVESGPSAQLWQNPQHRYTQELLEAVPQLRL